MKTRLLAFIASLATRARPALFKLAELAVRRFVGIGTKIWNELQAEIEALDADPTLTNGQRHAAAVEWLHESLCLPEQAMPAFFHSQDFESRVVQAAVLFRRLKNWLASPAA